jgi:Gpi18-like mannosyltransferase
LLFCLSVYKSSARMTADRLIEVATLSVLIVPYFLPKMHDRYFFPADVLSLILAFFFPRYFIVPVIIGLVSFLSYWPFLFGFEVVPLQLLAVVQLVPMLILLRHLALQLVPDVN